MEQSLKLIKAKIGSCPNKTMAGCELRRLRVARDMSEQQLAERLGTYRRQIQRWENKAWFELHPSVMIQLLEILGASSL